MRRVAAGKWVLFWLGWLGCLGCLGLLLAPSARAGTDKAPSCLPQEKADLLAFVKARTAPASMTARPGQSAPSHFVPVTRGSPRWMAAFNAILAWENDDCPAFSAFIEKMGYSAVEVIDPATSSRHVVVFEPSPDAGAASAQRKNGLFVLRARTERTRRLVITAPHLPEGGRDDRALRLYQLADAAVLLQSTAAPCSAKECSGCGEIAGYACGGCTRASDAAHSVDNMLFAMFAALEATRTHDGASPWLHFEYHGEPVQASARPNGKARTAAPACATPAAFSQGARTQLPASADAEKDSYPARFFSALKKRLDPRCVCYEQRQAGCLLESGNSVLGRLVNQESPIPFDPCTQEATRLSGRYIHFNGSAAPLPALGAALNEAAAR